AGRSAVGVASHRAARTHSVRHAEIDSRWRLLSGYDDPRAIGSAPAESVFAMQTNARTLHGSKRAVAPTCTSRSKAAPAWRRRSRGEGARERTRMSSAARSAATQGWFTQFFDDAYVVELSDQKPSRQTRREVDFLLRSLRVSPRSRILDVACGYGRHAAELSRRGFRVVGVDLSRAMLAEARQRFREGPRLRFVRGDMRRLDFAAEFDAVFSFFTSFGYFAPGQNEAALRRMARALRPGGRLLVDHRNPTHDAALPRRSWYRAGRQRLVLEDRRFDPPTKGSEGTQLVLAPGRRRALQRPRPGRAAAVSRPGVLARRVATDAPPGRPPADPRLRGLRWPSLSSCLERAAHRTRRKGRVQSGPASAQPSGRGTLVSPSPGFAPAVAASAVLDHIRPGTDLIVQSDNGEPVTVLDAIE